MVKVKAKFKGSNSLGYVHGHVFDLDILQSGFHPGGSRGSSITIRRSNSVSDGVCVYDRFEGFLKNWELTSCHSLGDQKDQSDDSLLIRTLTSTLRESKIEKILK